MNQELVAEDLDGVFADLRNRRIDLGMTQRQVAEAVGITRTQVANIESGRYGGNALTLARYARVVGLQLAVVRDLDAE